MKHLVLILCIVFAASPPGQCRDKKAKKSNGYFAPDDKGDSRAGFHAEGYRTFYTGYSLVSFERFRTSYNEVNGGRLKSPLGDLRPAGGFTWGGGAHVITQGGEFCFSFLRGSTEATATATYNNGDQREMKIEMKPITMNFDIMGFLSRRVSLGFALGMDVPHTKLYSGYRYAGGPLSYGTDQALNGVFRAKGVPSLTGGLRLDVAIVRQLRFTARAEYVGLFAGKQKGGDGSDYELLPWRDELYGYSSSGGVHTDGFNHFYLPEDVKAANNDYVYYVGQGSNFAKMYRGWRINVGLTLDLFTRKVNL